MGAVFSKKTGLNMLFVGCRTMSRDDVYAARKNSRAFRRGTGDFCDYIRFTMDSSWELTQCIPNRKYWFHLDLLNESKIFGLTGLNNIIRWRTEGK